MDGISTDALVGLAGVALGFVGSLIVMWFEGRREARRVEDQRRYERTKDRVDKVEPYIARLNTVSAEVRDAVDGIHRLLWLAAWGKWGQRPPPRMAQYYFDALQQAWKKAAAIEEEDPGIILDSLEPQILDGFHELQKSFNSLRVVAGASLSSASNAGASQDAEWIQRWDEDWCSQIVSEHETFKGVYKTLVIAIGNALEGRYRRPSSAKRLREWWGRRGVPSDD